MLQFLSYGELTHGITAVDGPAVGLTPADISLLETHYNAYERSSMSLVGEGNLYEDFRWAENHGVDRVVPLGPITASVSGRPNGAEETVSTGAM